MEFRRGTPGRRQNRRICPKCQIPSGQRERCAKCDSKTAARIEIVWYVDGKRNRELTYCWREQDASAVLQRKETDYWRQQELGVTREVGGTLRQAVDAYMATTAPYSAHYRKQIGTALNELAEGVGWERPITSITPEEITVYREHGLTTLSSASVRSYMLVVRRFFAYLHEEGWIRRNPTRKVKLPVAKKGRDHLRPEEVGPVLSVFWDKEPQIAPIATALVLGGWRKGEIVNLRYKDVYMEERWAYVLDFEGDELTAEWSPKTESSRRAVPLHPLVVRGLERIERVTCPDGRVSPWVFPVLDTRKRRRFQDQLGRMQPVYGDRRSPSTTFFGDKLRAVLTKAGVTRRVTIHGLRRTFAVLLQEAGAPDAVIRQALGHGARGVTETHYLPRRDETVQKWVNAIQVKLPALDNQPSTPDESADASQPETPQCHQAATNLVAKRPPYLRLVK